MYPLLMCVPAPSAISIIPIDTTTAATIVMGRWLGRFVMRSANKKITTKYANKLLVVLMSEVVQFQPVKL